MSFSVFIAVGMEMIFYMFLEGHRVGFIRQVVSCRGGFIRQVVAYRVVL